MGLDISVRTRWRACKLGTGVHQHARKEPGIRAGKLLIVSLFLFPVISSWGCSSTGIAIRESLGTPKREQLVDRVDETRDAQESAKEHFASTLD